MTTSRRPERWKATQSGDGGYDTKGCYDTISQRGAKATIPPRSNAKIQQHTNNETQIHPRDENL